MKAVYANQASGRLLQAMLAIVAWSVVASLVCAQPDGPREGGRGRGRGMGMMGPDLVSLALQKSVSEELKLTSDQTDRLKQIPEPERRGRGDSAEERQKNRLEAMTAREKKVAEVLEPGQLARLKQIHYQTLGPRAFALPGVASELKLTDEEKEKIRSAQEGGFRDYRKLFESGDLKEGDSEEIRAANREKFAKIDAAVMEKIMAVLTPEQQSKWKEVLGEPFKGKIEPPARGGERRRRGGNDN